MLEFGDDGTSEGAFLRKSGSELTAPQVLQFLLLRAIKHGIVISSFDEIYEVIKVRIL